MIKVKVDQTQINRLSEALKGKARKLPKELAIAINQTAKQVKTESARGVRDGLGVPLKVTKKTVRASSAKAKKLRSVIRLWDGYVIPLKYFKPKAIKAKRATRKRGEVVGGVSAQVPASMGGTVFVPGAFLTRKNRHVAKRNGNSNIPLQFFHGPSPGQAFKKLGIERRAKKTAQTQLPKNIERRIRFLSLQTSGGLRSRGNQ